MYSKRLDRGERPVFPKKAVVTAGMPYGNKHLHFGHVGGMMIHADIYARFLRDRIGKDNVIFVSGTDCYGSPIMESYRKLKDEGFEGTLEDYVMGNHENQKQTLDDYEISPNLFAASAFGRSGEIHKEVSANIFRNLYENGYIKKESTPQFYDEEAGVFLNGRQVVGKCPIAGCTSEHAYADECSLGHQYMPSELIDPVSALTGKKPSFRTVTNWYFVLDECLDELKERLDFLKRNSNTRKYELTNIDEFLKKPVLYVQKKYLEETDVDVESKLPAHTTIDEEKKKSVTYEFDSLAIRDEAKTVLDGLGIHYRSGKTLVPFRLSGNVEWGVPVPDMEDQKDLTFWVWPESLWAPISFTETYLESIGHDRNEWKDYWMNDDSIVYQFIGEDNIYFYAIAEMGLFQKLNFDGKMHLPHIIANRHILFMDKKASSSSEIKPPMAEDLLQYYTAEQLRMHFMSLGLSSKSTGFKPQVLMKEEDREGVDMVLKDGNLLTNVLNRLFRSCFYTAQKHYEGHIPNGTVSEKMKDLVTEKVLDYERHMYNHEFHRISYTLDELIRGVNKYWTNQMREADNNDNDELRRQTLYDCFYASKVIAILVHPVAPTGCEMFRDYMNLSEDMWNWDHIFDELSYYMGDVEKYDIKFLEPRTDFFEKLESQR